VLANLIRKRALVVGKKTIENALGVFTRREVVAPSGDGMSWKAHLAAGFLFY
jgi:hypothetical protein